MMYFGQMKNYDEHPQYLTNIVKKDHLSYKLEKVIVKLRIKWSNCIAIALSKDLYSDTLQILALS